jgi:hypothetical protein
MAECDFLQEPLRGMNWSCTRLFLSGLPVLYRPLCCSMTTLVLMCDGSARRLASMRMTQVREIDSDLLVSHQRSRDIACSADFNHAQDNFSCHKCLHDLGTV